MAKGKKATEVVEDIVKPICDELGLILWDVRFEKEGPDWFLRVFIDKEEGGITIEDCESVSRKADPLIDEEDPIKQAYFFEVSSAGLGRKLTKEMHFKTKIGSEVLAKLIRPIDNEREIQGILQDFDDMNISIKLEDKEVKIALKDTSFVKLCDDLDLF